MPIFTATRLDSTAQGRGLLWTVALGVGISTRCGTENKTGPIHAPTIANSNLRPIDVQ